MPGRLDGKLAIVTGGNSGIGEAMVHRFSAEGASVVFCARREEQGRSVEDAVRNAGGRARFFACDVTDAAQVSAFVEEAVGALGGLDIVVSNAGTGGVQPWPDETVEQWQSILDLNLNGMFFLCRAAWPHLVARSAGSIVAVTSLSGVGGHRRRPARADGRLPAVRLLPGLQGWHGGPGAAPRRARRGARHPGQRRSARPHPHPAVRADDGRGKASSGTSTSASRCSRCTDAPRTSPRRRCTWPPTSRSSSPPRSST